MNLAALVFLTMTIMPTFRAEFKPSEGGKTAVYTARWTFSRCHQAHASCRLSIRRRRNKTGGTRAVFMARQINTQKA